MKTHHMGMAHYARILGIVTKEPMRAGLVAQAMGRDDRYIRVALWGMVRCELVSVIAWEKTARKGMLMPVFARKRHIEAAYPGRRDPRQLRSAAKPLTPTMTQFRAFMAALKLTATRQELREETGAADLTIRATLEELRRQKIVRVVDHRREGCNGPYLQVFAFGSGPDAKRPEKKCPLLVAREYQRRQSAIRKMLRLIQATAGAANADLLECAA